MAKKSDASKDKEVTAKKAATPKSAAKSPAKKAAAKKTATKKAAAKKAAPKPAASASAPETAAPKKAAAKKTTAKKAATKKTTTTASAAKKSAAKKTATKKVATKKAAAKKTAAKKTAKKATSSKTTVKKTTKKATTKSSPAQARKPEAPKAPATPSSDQTPSIAKSRLATRPAPPKVEPASRESQGAIAPSKKRRAAAPDTTGSALYRAERERQRQAATISEEMPVLVEEQIHPAEAPELPKNYGRTKISALVRDPEWIYVYWEIATPTRAELGIQQGQHNRQLVLRVYDVTGIDFNGTNALSTKDVPVNDHTSSWYLRAPAAGRSYVVELGVFLDEGNFRAIARSNSVDLPAAQIAPQKPAEPKWVEKNQEVYRQILRLSGGTDVTRTIGSEEFVQFLQRKLIEESSSFSGAWSGVSSGLFSGTLSEASSEALSAGGAVRRVGKKGRDFWLEVGVDVIVYGATEPDAQVTLMGKPIQLSPEGTFRVRMAFPDGKIEFPVEATSSDGVETRRVRPVVERKTY